MTSIPDQLARYLETDNENTFLKTPYKDTIPALSKEEYSLLEESILAEGLREPILCFNNNIVDGHNRYKICTTNNIPYKTKMINVSNSAEAKEWMYKNQLARRNLTKEQYSYYRGKIYNQTKQKGKKVRLDQNDLIKSTASKLANKLNVSEPTIKRDGNYSEAIDTLTSNAGKVLTDQILTREILATKQEVVTLANLPVMKQQDIARKVITEKKNIKLAIHEVKKESEKEELLDKLDVTPADNNLINGDALIELTKLPDKSIDITITDLPYGLNYHSNRSVYNDHITKAGIVNDNETAVILLEKTIAILDSKMKDDSHLYFFSSWKTLSGFKAVIEKSFTIKNVIIWDKCNHGSGDLFYSYGNAYELIIFATRGKKKILTRKKDIITIPKIASSKLTHPAEKPVPLITELLEVSAYPDDMIVDPFMGSGSTIKAIKNYSDDISYLGIEIDKGVYDKTLVSIQEPVR